MFKIWYLNQKINVLVSLCGRPFIFNTIINDDYISLTTSNTKTFRKLLNYFTPLEI